MVYPLPDGIPAGEPTPGPASPLPDPAAAASAIGAVVEPAARLCAAARVLARHGEITGDGSGDRLLAEIDDAADVLQQGVANLVRTLQRFAPDAA
jgi:hypothetical protein